MIVVKRADNIESPDALIARLVQEYQVPLRRMCCIWLKDAALAEDAVQETFVKAWRAALSFRGECSEKTWLMRIAVHVCWDMRRSWWFRNVDRSVRLEHLPEPAVPFEERDDTLVRASDDENACSLERSINGKGYHGLFRKSRACQNSNCYVSWPQC